MTPAEVRAYYSRPEILDELFRMCKGREVIPVFAGGFYGKRPNSVQFKGDLAYFIKNGAVSFHCSVEHWRNPDSLSNDLKRQDMDKMRTGWDFVLDIDSDAGIEVAKMTARLIVEELRKNGVKSVSAKFSGRRGFHIGVPCGAFPEFVNLQPTETQFPLLAQKIAHYLKEAIKEKLTQEMLSFDPTLESRITDGRGKDPYAVVEAEENWSVRHLFRMPYSLNEKTWNVSLPVDPARIMGFSPSEADPKIVKPKFKFLDEFEKNEAERLVQKALEFDMNAKYAKENSGFGGSNPKKDKDEALRKHLTDGYGVIVMEENRRKTIDAPDSDAEAEDSGTEFMLSGIRRNRRNPYEAANTPKIPEENFPPCIKMMLQGLPDGRKRSIFVLINFLHTVGYNWDEIDLKLKEWNAKNPEPISESYLKGQLEYARKNDKKILPPNCSNAGYYKDIKVCIPDNYCAPIKNPAGYAARKSMSGRTAGNNAGKKGRAKSGTGKTSKMKRSR